MTCSCDREKRYSKNNKCNKEDACCKKPAQVNQVTIPPLLFDCVSWELLFGAQVIDLSCLRWLIPCDMKSETPPAQETEVNFRYDPTIPCFRATVPIPTSVGPCNITAWSIPWSYTEIEFFDDGSWCYVAWLDLSWFVQWPWQVGAGLFSVNLISDWTNASSGDYSLVWGTQNTGSGDRATISWGIGNVASNEYAFIGWGQSNSGSAKYTVIAWWVSNSIAASWDYSTIAWWIQNSISSTISTIGGWSENNISAGSISTIAGWYKNTIAAAGGWSTIGWWAENAISTWIYGTIAWWNHNVILSERWAILGWLMNNVGVSAKYSSIVGGNSNMINGDLSFIGWWYNNRIAPMGTTSTIASVICGWYANLIDLATDAFIWWGTLNHITDSGSLSSILWWNANFIDGQVSSIIGNYNHVNNSFEILVGNYLTGNAMFSMVFGHGIGAAFPLENNEGAMYFGMNSDVPSLIIDDAWWSLWWFGRVWVGLATASVLKSQFNNGWSLSEMKIISTDVDYSVLHTDRIIIVRASVPLPITNVLITLPNIGAFSIGIGKTYEIKAFGVFTLASIPHIVTTGWDTIDWAALYAFPLSWSSVTVRAVSATERAIFWS